MEPPEPGGGAFTLIRDSSLSQIKERGEILTNTSAVVPDMTDTNASRAAVDAAEHYSAYISTFTFTIFEDFSLVNPSMKLNCETWGHGVELPTEDGEEQDQTKTMHA